MIYSGLILAGGAVGYLIRVLFSQAQVKRVEEEAKKILHNAQKEAETKRKEVELESKERWYKARSDFERETKDKRIELQNMERRVAQRQENLDKKVDLLDRKEKEFSIKERELIEAKEKVKTIEHKYDKLLKEEHQKLERISGMTAAEAKEELKVTLLGAARHEAGYKIRKIEDDAKETANNKARHIISLAIQRCAADHVTETTVSVVDLPGDDMKGRIIGREGRNIRAFEVATGTDLIIDDTPGAVILSGYDPIRREVARIALEKLVNDGRIHPGRIEEIVAKAKKEVAVAIREEGERAALDVGIAGLHPEEIKLIGRLKYRTSYSQNVLQHSKEVAYLAGIMAAELGLNVKLAKRGGLLHDIGKAVDHQTEGTHAQIGVDLAKRYNESRAVINAIAAHHEDVEAICIETVLVAAADALSASRPGARREMLETYVKRLEDLEKIGDSFKGVEKAFAIQAGREIRIVVKPNEINDNDAMFLSKDIAKKIEKEMAYPGEIRVTVIRETRNVEYAR